MVMVLSASRVECLRGTLCLLHKKFILNKKMGLRENKKEVG